MKRARLILAAAACSLAAFAAWVRLGPLPEGLLEPERRTSTEIVDRNDVPLYEARSADGTRTRVIGAGDLPPVLVAATLAAELNRETTLALRWRRPGLAPRDVIFRQGGGDAWELELGYALGR